MSNTLSVCYTSDNNYAHILGTAIYSLLVNNRDIENISIYVLDNGISQINKEIIDGIVKKFERKCYFLDVTKQLEEVVKSNATSYGGFSTYARIYIQRLIPENIEKLLYIDTDTIVMHSLKDLMKLDLTGYVLAAIKDTITSEYRQGLRMEETDSYFNAGVLYINMKKWRNDKIEECLLKLLPKVAPYCINADQDLINIALGHKIYALPMMYNCMATPLILKLKDVFRIFKINSGNYYDLNDAKESLDRPYIIHFNSGLGSRPWVKRSKHPYSTQWLKLHVEAYGSEFERLEPVGKQKTIISIMNKCPYGFSCFLYEKRVKINGKRTKVKYLKLLNSEIFVK